MPAFTHLCKKVKISLSDDTITIYPKNNLFILQLTPPELLMLDILKLIKSMELGNPYYELKEGDCYEKYQRDIFGSYEMHLHIRYGSTINLPMLQQILAVFVKFNVITTEEKVSFLTAYKSVAPNNSLALTNTRINTTLTTAAFMADQRKANYQKINEQLKLLKEQTNQLKRNGFNHDMSVADDLRINLLSAIRAYDKNKTSVTYSEFKSKCIGAISNARATLEEHQEWDLTLRNIMLAMTIVGIFVVIAELINLTVNNRLLFFSRADSIKKVNDLEQLVFNQPVPPLPSSMEFQQIRVSWPSAQQGH